MLKFSEKNLYNRCGVIDVPMDNNKKTVFNGKFQNICGTKLPIINFNFQSGVKFKRSICLRTMFGYIPIENINEFKDIFNISKYCKDETEWSILYDDKTASPHEKEQVKKLSLTLGKHWKYK